MKKIIFSALCLIAPQFIFGQLSLTEIPTTIPAFKTGFYDWSDFDNDGDQDLVIYGNSAGTFKSRIYRNDGNFNFSDAQISLPNAGSGEVRWGDYNNDNKKDLLFSADNGGVPGNFSRIYKNTNNQAFTDIQITLPTNQSNEGSGLSSIWSDLNNDGLLDVITKGYISPCNYFFRVFRNNGGDSFTEAFSFTGTDNGRIVSGDVDNDGLKDIAFQGFSYCNNPQGLTRILKNQGNFNFTDLNAGLPGVLGIPNFVDFNNDGKLDIFVCGRVSGGQTAKLFINNLPTGYTESPIQFPAGEYFTEWHDFDSDGFKDVFFSVDTVFKIFKNNGGTSISEVSHNVSVSGMPRILDINGDGKKELFINQGTGSKLYSFQSATANCPDLSGSLLQGLVGYWPFCGNANDESGNGNNGTVNGATLTADRFGNQASAYSFNSNYLGHTSGAEYIRCSKEGPKGGKSRTFTLWVKTDSLSISSLNNTLISYGGNEFAGSSNQFRIVLNGTCSQSIQAMTYGGNRDVNYFPNNNWDFISVVYDSTIGSNISGVKIFLNGNLIQTYCNETPGGNINTSNLNSLTFGRYHDLNWTPDPGYFKGSLDDIAIWNRALTPQEIQQVYNQGICQTSITVTDTLLIHTGITSYNPVAYGNTLKVWPNPSNTAITLDAGNLALMQGWKIRISNAQGVQIYPASGQSGLISQQQQTLSMSAWGGNGLYFLYLIDPQNNIQEVKKIVLAP
jgi:hypothetical protein